MEKEKYYTPTIEEFHVGFECEYNDPLKGSWEKVIYTEDMFFGGKRGLTLLEKRVKYLDQEDIESLGWSQEMVLNVWSETENDFVNGFIYSTNEKDKYVLLYDTETNTLGIYLQRIYNQISGNWEEHKMFSGIIQNKSELKKLMYQLQILP